MTQIVNAALVVGWVERFNLEKGFGFVSPLLTERHPVIGDAGNVFIHAGQCRMFEGVPEEPRIGTRRVPRDWAAQNVRPAHGPGGTRFACSYVAMRVVPGDKGPRAEAWVVIPRRQTVEDVLRFGGLEKYLGMEAAILPADQRANGGLWGVLSEATLSESRLRLTLTSPRESGNVPTGQESTTREIDFDYLRVRTDDHDQLVLNLARDNAKDLQVVCWRRPPR